MNLTQLPSRKYLPWSLYALSLAFSALLCVVWQGNHDWVKLPITVGLQSKAFQMLVTRQSTRLVFDRAIITICTYFYAVLQYSLLESPVAPVLVEQSAELEFNTSSIGDCHLTRGSELCFTDPYSWYVSDLPPVLFDDNVNDIIEFLTRLNDLGIFGVSEEQHEPCKAALLRMMCNTLLPMCQYSCKPIKSCHTVCLEVNHECGDTLGIIFADYAHLVPDIAASLNADQESLDLVIQMLEDVFGGCGNTTFAEESDYLCMTSDAYETDLSGISPDGECTRDTGVHYAKYLDSIDTTSIDEYNEALDEYRKEDSRRSRIRLLISLTILCLIAIFQVVTFALDTYRNYYYEEVYFVDYEFVSPSCRLQGFTSGVLTALLCFILHSSIIKLNLDGFFLFLGLIIVICSGRTSSTCIFLQDLTASKYYAKVMNLGRKERTPKKRSKTNPVNLYRAYMKFYFTYFARNGKFEYLRYISSEAVEIGLQVNVMFGLTKTENTLIMMIYITIISVNLIVTPILLLHPSPSIWRTLNRLVDSFLDIAYLILIYTTLNDNGINRTSDIVIGLFLPSYRLTARIYWLSFSIVHENARARLGQTNDTVADGSNQARILQNPHKIHKGIKAMLVIVFVGSGLLLFISSVWRVTSKRKECNNIVGDVVWDALEDHVMFPDGLLGEISCNFESVRVLNLSDSSLTSLSGSVSNLVNLEVLDLSYNSLTTLPVELMALEGLVSMKTTDNDIHIKLDWSGLAIQSYRGEFFDLIPTLEHLDLSNNSISSMSNMSSSSLKSLTYLDLSRNNLMIVAEEYISAMKSLKTLNLSMNHLIRLDDIVWSMENLKRLDLSFNSLTQVSYIWPTRQNDFIAYVGGNPVTSIDWSTSLSVPLIQEIPDEISALSQLTQFTATHQQLLLLGGLPQVESLVLVNLSYAVIPFSGLLCNSRYLQQIDSAYTSDPLAYEWFFNCSSNYSVKLLNISGISVEIVSNPDSKLAYWVSLEHLVVNDLKYNENFSTVSSNLSSLIHLKTLSLKNSPITGFDLSPIPQNLTMIDLRNTSMTLNQTILTLQDFNCTHPVPFVCTRSI